MRKLKTLPPMHCDPGCGDCCGPAPCTESEYQQIVRYIDRNGIIPINGGLTCPLHINGQCAVYDVRPLTCRLFGHTERMPCPRGHSVFVDERQIERMWRAHGKATRLPHELIPGLIECLPELFEREREAITPSFRELLANRGVNV